MRRGGCAYQAMQRELVDFVTELTRETRVILLGELAVIGHGMDRGTKDADLWMEPMDSTEEWLDILNLVLDKFEGARIVTLPGWESLCGAALVENLEQVGMHWRQLKRLIQVFSRGMRPRCASILRWRMSGS